MSGVGVRAALAAVVLAAAGVLAIEPAIALPPPAVTSMSTHHGTDKGGTQVTVHGSGLTHVQRVYFGGVRATQVVVASATTLTVRSPAQAAGAVQVRVVTSGGWSPPVSAAGFTYYPALTWTRPSPTGAGALVSVSCPTSGFCVAVSSGGDAVVLHGHTWSAPTHVANSLVSVSCPTATYCLAVNSTDYAVYNSGSWSAAHTADPSGDIWALSCPSTTFCMLVDQFAQFATFDGSEWAPPQPVPGDFEDGMESVSCSSRYFCLGSDVDGVVYVLRGSTVGANEGLLSEPGLYGLACTSSTFCAAIDGLDHHAIWRHQNGGWARTGVYGITAGTSLTAVSCTSHLFCTAVDDHGDAFTTSGASFSPPQRVVYAAGGFSAIDCATSHFCVGVGTSGRAVIGTRSVRQTARRTTAIRYK